MRGPERGEKPQFIVRFGLRFRPGAGRAEAASFYTEPREIINHPICATAQKEPVAREKITAAAGQSGDFCGDG